MDKRKIKKKYEKVCFICGRSFIAESQRAKMCKDVKCRKEYARRGRIKRLNRLNFSECENKTSEKTKKNELDIWAQRARDAGMHYGDYVAKVECRGKLIRK